MMQELQKGQNDLLPEVTNLIPVFIENLGNPKVSINRLALLLGIVFFKSKYINKKTVITYPDFFHRLLSENRLTNASVRTLNSHGDSNSYFSTLSSMALKIKTREQGSTLCL